MLSGNGLAGGLEVPAGAVTLVDRPPLVTVTRCRRAARRRSTDQSNLQRLAMYQASCPADGSQRSHVFSAFHGLLDRILVWFIKAERRNFRAADTHSHTVYNPVLHREGEPFRIGPGGMQPPGQLIRFYHGNDDTAFSVDDGSASDGIRTQSAVTDDE